MSKTVKLLIILVTLIIFIAVPITMYNKVVRLNEFVATKHADISVQLERRADLIPNLINTVKGYAAHEKEIFENVAKARQGLINAKNIEEQALANTQMNSVLGRLFAIAEAYPELKANDNFIKLQYELAGTENRIAVARRDYNSATREYNTIIKTFPTVLLANIFGFTDKTYFEISDGKEDVPQINF